MNYSLSEVNVSPIWRNTRGHILMETMAGSTVLFTMLDNKYSYYPSPNMVVPF